MDFAAGPDTEEEIPIPQIIYLVHGWLAFAAFGFFFPVAIMIARFGQHLGANAAWFQLHRALNIVGLILATASLAIAFNKFGTPLDIPHMKLGVALGIVIWLQPLIAFLRPHKGDTGRVTWYMLHWLFGMVAVIFGVVNIELGLNAFKEFATEENHPGERIHTCFAIYISVLGFLYLFLQQLPYLARQRNEHSLRLPREDSFNLAVSDKPARKVTDDTTEMLSTRTIIFHRTAEMP